MPRPQLLHCNRLMFLQVPPYPEVFRDSLHTYKLNEQDTDVRAAPLLPVSSHHLICLLGLWPFMYFTLSSHHKGALSFCWSLHSVFAASLCLCVSLLSSQPLW